MNSSNMKGYKPNVNCWKNDTRLRDGANGQTTEYQWKGSTETGATDHPAHTASHMQKLEYLRHKRKALSSNPSPTKEVNK
jgi:hypothetical protein